MTTASNADMIIISKAEHDFRKWEIAFTPADMQEMVEYRDVFIRFVEKRIHKYRANLAMLMYKIEEVPKIYTYIEELLALKKTLEDTKQDYKTYINSIEKEKKKDH